MRKALRKTGILAFILAIYFSFSVAAAQTVSLENGRDGVTVQISGMTDASTMKLAFEIKTQQGICRQAAFEFDENIVSEVQECRYNEDTGILTLYLSGTGNLFPEGSLTLGKITFQAEENTKIQVLTVTDSFAWVGEDGRETSAELLQAGIVWSNEGTEEETTSEKKQETTVTEKETGKGAVTTASEKESAMESDLQKSTKAEQKVTEKAEATTIKGKSEKATDRTGTGDSRNVTGYVIGIVAAALVLVIGFCWKKKHK